MEEIIKEIDELLSHATDMAGFHNHHKQTELPGSIYWRAMAIVLDFRLWSAEISIKAGMNANDIAPVAEYLIEISKGVNNQLLILKEKRPIKN